MVDPTAPPVLDAPAPQAPAPQPSAPASDPNDPFSVDEARLSNWAPEQRAVLDEWKKKASDTIGSRERSAEEKYKAHVEKATALDQLTRHPEFQKWWMEQNKPKGPDAPAQPQDIATPEEWSSAVIDASNGSPQKLQALNMKLFTNQATPIVQQLQQKQQLLETTLEMKSLWERHPDAKDLDAIGRNPADPADKTPSLLEIALTHAVEKQGKSIEEGYALARKWADALGKNAEQKAFGVIQDKKDAVTAGPSTSSATGLPVVEVDNFEELTRKTMSDMLDGKKPVKYVVRSKSK